MRYSCTLYGLAAKLSEKLYEIAIILIQSLKWNQIKQKEKLHQRTHYVRKGISETAEKAM